MAFRVIPPSDLKQVLNLAKTGQHCLAISRATGISTTGVKHIAARHGITLTHGKTGPQGDDIKLRAIKELYRLTGSKSEVARVLKVTPSQVRYDLLKAALLSE
jgi:hypothetical protein